MSGIYDFKVQIRFFVNAELSYGCWQCVELGCIAKISEKLFVSIFRDKTCGMGKGYSFKTSATQPKYPKTGPISRMQEALATRLV
jgi:hypothetical protein